MYVVADKAVFVQIPRMGSTSVVSFLKYFKLGKPHPGHMHSPVRLAANAEWGPFATIQDPTRWYPSFWRYFVDPPKTIERNPILSDYHLRLSRGLGFKGWLERVTVGRGPADVSDPMMLPLSPRGEGQGVDSFPHHDFWEARQGHGLFSYVFRWMVSPRTWILRVCNLEEELDEVLAELGIEVTDEMRAYRKKAWPACAVGWKPKLDDEMRDWIIRADAALIDEYRPCAWRTP